MKYRKKRIVIDAIQFTPFNTEEVEEFVGGDMGKTPKGKHVIATLEGGMELSLYDWVIKGVNGEFYPVKSDIFLKTYEKVEE